MTRKQPGLGAQQLIKMHLCVMFCTLSISLGLSSFVGAETMEADDLAKSTIDRSLRIASYMNPLANAAGGSPLSVGYFERDVVDLLASSLNFTYEVLHTPDVVGPGLDVNGEWNGCVGQVKRKEVDICASFAQTWESSEKRGQFEFSFPIMWDYIGLITPRRQQRDKSLIIFAPFHPIPWLCIFIGAVIVTTLLWFSHAYRGGAGACVPYSRWVLFVVASLSIGERGFVLYQSSVGNYSRVFALMVLFWCWPVIVLATLYEAVLFSMLAVPNYSYLVHDIRELPGRPEISVYVWEGSAIDEYLIGLTDGPYKSLGDQLRMYPEQRLPQGDLDRLFELIDGQKVFLIAKTICESIMIEDAKKNKPGRLYMPDSEVFLPRGRQMTLQHGSWMAPIFDAKILLLQQHGLIDYAARKNFRRTHPPKHVYEEGRRPMTLYDLTGPFILLSVGIAVSALRYLYELVAHWREEKFRRRH